MEYLGYDDNHMEVNCDIDAINSVKDSLTQLARDCEIDSNHLIFNLFMEWLDAQTMIDRYGDMTEEGRTICNNIEKRIK